MPALAVSVLKLESGRLAGREKPDPCGPCTHAADRTHHKGYRRVLCLLAGGEECTRATVTCRIPRYPHLRLLPVCCRIPLLKADCQFSLAGVQQACRVADLLTHQLQLSMRLPGKGNQQQWQQQRQQPQASDKTSTGCHCYALKPCSVLPLVLSVTPSAPVCSPVLPLDVPNDSYQPVIIRTQHLQQASAAAAALRFAAYNLEPTCVNTPRTTASHPA